MIDLTSAHTCKLHHIVAASENNVIGRDGGMPWHIPEDFKYFKKVTMGSVLFMGRKTWDSIGRALPGRATIVVSRDKNFHVSGDHVFVAATVEEGLKKAKSICSEWNNSVFVVGGGEIYRQTLNYAESIYLTRVHVTIDGDTTYPEVDLDRFKLEASTPKQISSSETAPNFTFLLYSKKPS